MPEAPTWARALVLQVCAEAGAPTPRLSWRFRDRPTSSGVTRRAAGSISVVAGQDPMDQRLTLLHELAHWLDPALAAPRRRGARRVGHHGLAFYRLAFSLYERFGVPAAFALTAEAGRYASSLGHARRLGIAGAEEAWKARRAAIRDGAASRRPLRILVPEHRVQLVRDGRWTRCATCGVRIVGPVLRRMRRRPGRHVTYSVA
ncbi:MAG TPA: hypothetical protein VFK36_02120 [Gemmatimonadales bacterium]|nr:hypothetical protein [Gemmatimonadales bacterium]